jgi:signal transduction histidine kinase
MRSFAIGFALGTGLAEQGPVHAAAGRRTRETGRLLRMFPHTAASLRAPREDGKMPAMRRWDDIRRYARFGAEDEARLRELAPIVRPRFTAIVDAFYARIAEHEDARRVFTGGEAQVARLKVSLLDWLETTFAGPWDVAYFQKRSRIGRVHVWVGLEPRYMILAMHLVRVALQRAAFSALAADPARQVAAIETIAKICDVELAIMLETYGDEYALQLKRRERLAAVGQLGASISHEVKNPLGVIATSVFALKEHFRDAHDERAARHLDRIERNVEQASEIVTSLLEFLRTREPERVDRDWGALVAEAADRAHLPPGVRVELAPTAGTGRAEVDPVQLGRVVANLVRNGAEAMPEGGAVAVAASGDRDFVELTVRDRGPGLPSDVLPQLFEPLFTTKPVGTGLGLALAKAIVEAHGGTIRAGNAEGGGAEFRVRIPRRAAKEGA